MSDASEAGIVVAPARPRGPAERFAPRRTVSPDPRFDSSWLSRSGRHEETAQVVVRSSISLAAAGPGADIGRVALALLRVANNDRATLEHALVVCRSLARDDSADERLNAAIRLLERVIVFLAAPARAVGADDGAS
jgi:hypothetical protein